MQGLEAAVEAAVVNVIVVVNTVFLNVVVVIIVVIIIVVVVFTGCSCSRRRWRRSVLSVYLSSRAAAVLNNEPQGYKAKGSCRRGLTEYRLLDGDEEGL